eukprot:CAMPEP_0185772212 /NCGR_PEP_ID=MMETSP1174-20130828/67697_1 /TAXON_ID=35687 /ORGANISM="Dictyocha speculum, Strain CCMP1381" /LENGTH=474 /DNA_ID=CAMNT_0028458363 /DNA_START=44 /DNA_END=1468 /DNA_ORIENTATION=-
MPSFFRLAALALAILPLTQALCQNRALLQRRRLTVSCSTTPREELRFLKPTDARAVRELTGTPVYVYDMASLRGNAEEAMKFPNSFGLTARYAMKSCPNAAILKLFAAAGLHFDASSTHEVKRAMAAGIDPACMSLSSQELTSPDFADLVGQGLKVNACSLRQLDTFGEKFPGAEVGVRFNPGLGSGGTSKTNVGGPSSSFGIWHKQIDEVKAIAEKHGLKVVRIHTHIGSGSDPDVWTKVSGLSLDLCRQFKDVSTLNLGGGYKVARVQGEKSTDLQLCGGAVKVAFEEFAKETGRELKLEIEPGTFLVANSGALVASVQDKVSTIDDDTGASGEGHIFLKLDAGMTEVLRPSLYGSQHPLIIVPAAEDEERGVENVVVVGHCCESGDLISCAPDAPETLAERELTKAEVGDIVVLEGAGAYCSAMSTKNYNSFPEAPEVLLAENGELHVIRQRQPVEEIWKNEVPIPDSLLS